MVRALLQDGTTTRSLKRLFGSTPVFYTLKLKTPQRIPRHPHLPFMQTLDLKTYTYDITIDNITHTITYRPATLDDLQPIRQFVDFWLSGGAKRLGIPGGGADYFVPTGQQIGYLQYKITYLAIDQNKIIGWAVKSQNDTLIHLLVDASYRGKAVGSTLLKILNPTFVRSKSDQSTGNPLKFYLKAGYQVTESATGKHKNIDLLKKV